ncbi:D-alanyl-D-alanine carboxypeptidase family protein [Anaerosalibacter sp. Marseille-P3206]|uniref:D-alanyl-D-alanine carboxypeptidase family protein n=1 Tax=Anaerosalibacter sp. Marseille-P3206 TaxID=1871005 RepID=UPI0009850E54|nr:D-alanyl-D-alanine carboxypeptidase family protein [Anaerosalibacter sp. Marseille-P3206]
MKKFLLILVILITACTYSFSYADSLDIVGEGAILIDGDTGQILYEKNSHMKLYPASTTKIMTGILAIELGNLDDIVTIDKDIINATDGTHIALDYDEQMSLKNLVYALLIESANDAAAAIAKNISGSIDEFATLMNKKATEMGALDTHFTNPSGLPDENHVTTAYDLAMIAKYAMNNETFRNIVKQYSYTIPPTNKKSESRYICNHNKLLFSKKKIQVDGKIIPIKYEWADGIKNGYTQVADQCLVSSATKGNRKLICVVLKSHGSDIYVDTHKLLNYGFNEFEKTQLSFKNEFIDNIDIQNGSIPLTTGIIGDSLYTIVPKNNLNKIEKKINIQENIEAPIEKGQVLGNIEYTLDGKLLGQADIISTMEITKVEVKSKLLSKWWVIIIVLIIILFKISEIVRKSKRRKRRKTLYKRINDPIK